MPSKAWSSSLYRSRMKVSGRYGVKICKTEEEAETQRGGGKRSRSTRYRGARQGALWSLAGWPPSATVELEVTRAEATNDQVRKRSTQFLPRFALRSTTCIRLFLPSSSAFELKFIRHHEQLPPKWKVSQKTCDRLPPAIPGLSRPF